MVESHLVATVNVEEITPLTPSREELQSLTQTQRASSILDDKRSKRDIARLTVTVKGVDEKALELLKKKIIAVIEAGL